MSQFLSIRDGGKTNEEGAQRFWRAISSNGAGPLGVTDFAVSQHAGGANTSVDIAVGNFCISYQNYLYFVWTDAVYNLTGSPSNTSGFTRIDSIVAYVDLSVVSSSSNNNPGALKFLQVGGTPSGSPVAPNGTTIQAAVGSGNPYYVLANVTLANNYTQIVNANIADKRTRFLVGNSGAIPPFSVAGSLVVQNGGFMPNWIVPPGISAINSLYGTVGTAPSGSSLTVRLYNVTQAHDVGTLTFSSGSTTANNTSMTNPSLNTGDVIRFDVTAVGSTTAGADVLIQPSA